MGHFLKHREVTASMVSRHTETWFHYSWGVDSIYVGAELPCLLLCESCHCAVPPQPKAGHYWLDGSYLTVQGGFVLVFKFVRMDSTSSQWDSVANM